MVQRLVGRTSASGYLFDFIFPSFVRQDIQNGGVPLRVYRWIESQLPLAIFVCRVARKRTEYIIQLKFEVMVLICVHHFQPPLERAQSIAFYTSVSFPITQKKPCSLCRTLYDEKIVLMTLNSTTATPSIRDQCSAHNECFLQSQISDALGQFCNSRSSCK